MVNLQRQIVTGTVRMAIVRGSWWPAPSPIAACDVAAGDNDVLDVEVAAPAAGAVVMLPDLFIPPAALGVEEEVSSHTNVAGAHNHAWADFALPGRPGKQSTSGAGAGAGSGAAPAPDSDEALQVLATADATAAAVEATMALLAKHGPARDDAHGCDVWWPPQLSRRQKDAIWASR